MVMTDNIERSELSKRVKRELHRGKTRPRRTVPQLWETCAEQIDLFATETTESANESTNGEIEMSKNKEAVERYQTARAELERVSKRDREETPAYVEANAKVHELAEQVPWYRR